MFPLFNLVKKLRFRIRNETLPRDKFLTVNQQQKVKNKKKVEQKYPNGHYNKKLFKRPKGTTYPYNNTKEKTVG